MYNFLYRLGKYFINVYRYMAGHTRFCLKVSGRALMVTNLFNPAVSLVMFRQIYFIGVELFAIMTFTALVMGMIVVGGAGKLLVILNAKESLGAILTLIVVRSAAPIIVGLLVILRSSTTFIMEISMMKSSGELKALEAMNVDLYNYVYLPRIFATLVSVLVLSTYFAFVSIIGGYVLLSFLLDTTLDTIMRQVFYDISFSDVAAFIFKTVLIGFTAASIPIYTALEARQDGTTDVMRSFITGMMRLFFTFIVIVSIGEIFI